MILLQGLEDQVVPPNQAELMVEALRAKGLPVAYLAVRGRAARLPQAANIKRSLEAELYFYGPVLGFELADAPAPIVIYNWLIATTRRLESIGTAIPVRALRTRTRCGR